MPETRSLLTPAQLESATDLIEEVHHLLGWDHPTVAVGIISYDGNEAVTSAKPLESADPLDELVGFTAQTDWLAFGVVALGTAHAISEPRWSRAVEVDGGAPAGDDDAGPAADRGSDPFPPGRVRMATMVSRDGRSCQVMRHLDGPRIVSPAETEWGYGRVDDYCRRVLGLPTRPPTHDVRHLWTAVWLDAMWRSAIHGDRSPERFVQSLDLPGDADRQAWLALIAQHRSAALFLHSDAALLFPGGLPRPDEMTALLTRVANCHARVQPWEALREQVVAESTTWMGIPSADAAWLDEGAFSRMVLGRTPPPDMILEDLRGLLSAKLHRRVRQTVASWRGPLPPREE